MRLIAVVVVVGGGGVFFGVDVDDGGQDAVTHRR